jgi:hypothetical protein
VARGGWRARGADILRRDSGADAAQVREGRLAVCGAAGLQLAHACALPRLPTQTERRPNRRGKPHPLQVQRHQRPAFARGRRQAQERCGGASPRGTRGSQETARRPPASCRVSERKHAARRGRWGTQPLGRARCTARDARPVTCALLLTGHPFFDAADFLVKLAIKARARARLGLRLRLGTASASLLPCCVGTACAQASQMGVPNPVVCIVHAANLQPSLNARPRHLETAENRLYPLLRRAGQRPG